MNIEYRAATLAIGTELTDGQIIDRNSAWISKKLVSVGLEVTEHRSVADDRKTIGIALGELNKRVSHLFITGGLGPTSDDFTREVLADHYGRKLVFDEPSWQRIVERFKARGVEARPIQRQQCFFPRDAEILENTAGTANAFRFKVDRGGQPALHVYVMPGPPIEISAVWDLHYKDVMNRIVPREAREELYLFKTLGRGESEIAEVVEKEISDKEISAKELRVGYRAHLPYVEVKLWFKEKNRAQVQPAIDAIEKNLSASIVTHGVEDMADAVIETLKLGHALDFKDGVTRGALQARLVERMPSEFSAPLTIEGSWAESAAETQKLPLNGLLIELLEDAGSEQWRLRVKNAHGKMWDLAVPQTSIYKFGTERGRRYFTEKVFQLLKAEILPFITAPK